MLKRVFGEWKRRLEQVINNNGEYIKWNISFLWKSIAASYELISKHKIVATLIRKKGTFHKNHFNLLRNWNSKTLLQRYLNVCKCYSFNLPKCSKQDTLVSGLILIFDLSPEHFCKFVIYPFFKNLFQIIKWHIGINICDKSFVVAYNFDLCNKNIWGIFVWLSDLVKQDSTS